MFKIAKKFAISLGVLPVATMLIATPASSAEITGLFNTGVDRSGSVLSQGSVDPNYSILETGTSPETIFLRPVHGNYVPNDSDSAWIWQDSDGSPNGIHRTFRTTFDLSGFDPSTASISGSWTADNYGRDILINGISTGQITSRGNEAFKVLTDFSIDSGFVSGLNTLDFVVDDAGGVAGFRVDNISGTAEESDPKSVPEPTSVVALLTVGGLAAGLKRRKA